MFFRHIITTSDGKFETLIVTLPPTLRNADTFMLVAFARA